MEKTNDFTVNVGKHKISNKKLNDFYFSGRKYIVAYRSVYALEWCSNYVNPDGSFGGCGVREIAYCGGDTLTKRGKWQAVTAEEVNKLLGHDLLIVR